MIKDINGVELKRGDTVIRISNGKHAKDEGKISAITPSEIIVATLFSTYSVKVKKSEKQLKVV